MLCQEFRVERVSSWRFFLLFFDRRIFIFMKKETRGRVNRKSVLSYNIFWDVKFT